MGSAVPFDEVLRRGSSVLRGQVPAPVPGPGLRILFLVSAHNSLSQRAQVALTELGHEVSVAVVDSGPAMEAAVEGHRPELIVCPFLTKIIPESVYSKHRCLVVHPGPVGDRGPSSLDWAIELGMGEWGVTVLEATGEVDGGDIWATRKFPTRPVGTSSLSRHEVRRGAVEAVVEAVAGVGDPDFSPTPLDYDDPRVTGRPMPMLSQAERSIERAGGVRQRRQRSRSHARGRIILVEPFDLQPGCVLLDQHAFAAAGIEHARVLGKPIEPSTNGVELREVSRVVLPVRIGRAMVIPARRVLATPDRRGAVHETRL